MPNSKVFSTLITACVAVPSVVILLCVGSARAQTSSANYTFMVASGFLCDPSDSGSCPAVAKSANGDSYEISGAGIFDAHNKSIKAAGTFSHKSTSGNVLETGVWIASELVGFDSYGIALGALVQKGPSLSPQQLGPKRIPMRPVPLATGGLATLRIRLLPVSGLSRTAVLQINCALAEVPHERLVEGIRLTIEKNPSEYSEEVSGRVMFLALRPDVSMPARPEQGASPEAPEQPQK